MKGHHLESTEEIQRSVTQAVNDIPQAAFKECYKLWQHRWKTCVQAQGMHFEGDRILVDGYKIKLFCGTNLVTLLSDLVYQIRQPSGLQQNNYGN